MEPKPSVPSPGPTSPSSTPGGNRFCRLFWNGKRKFITIAAVVLVMALPGPIIFFTTHSHGGKSNNEGNHKITNDLSGGPNVADCGTTKQLLQNSPVAVQDLSTIIPIGNFAPPGHIGPTPHMYYNYKNVGTGTEFSPAKTNIYAPADIVVTRISLFDNASSPTPFPSYRIDFSVCKQVNGYFIHTLALADKLNAAIQPPYQNTQTSAVGGTTSEHVYSNQTNLTLKAGELMATAGGSSHAPWGLDFGLVDNRLPEPATANPARWKNDGHYACSLDYYPAALSATLYGHIGDYRFQYLSPGDPKCGVMYPDVPGTAQGVWFTPDVPKDNLGDPAKELVLAHSNFDHSQGVFAMGNQLQTLGIDTTAIYSFTPASTGTVGLDFNKVKPGGVYCYQLKSQTNYSAPDTIVLLQMSDVGHLRVGTLKAGSCGSGPWQFGAFIDYIR